MERGECKRLMVSMPPRIGKSLTTSARFPSWYLGRNPDKRVITSSHTATLAESFSRKSRNELTEYGPEVFDVAVASDSSATDRWDIEGHDGGLVAVGVGGAVAGKGADLLIIDDPVKNAQDAESETQRAAKVLWYQEDARTRLHPGAAIILVMTRWHENDLAGWLQAEAAAGGEQWELLVLPMLDEDGAHLWPGRYTQAEIDGLKSAVGSRAWEALYQQRPAPAEGALLKREWWKEYREAPAGLTLLQSWDMTFKDTKGSDFVVGQVWGKSGASYYLLDQVRGRWDFPRTCAELKALTARWPEATLKLVEDAANGPAVISQLRETVEGLVAVKPAGSKEARCAAVSPLMEGGNVYLPRKSRAPWLESFLLEATSFPFGANDDQVDAMTQALNRLKSLSNWVPSGAPQGGGSGSSSGTEH